MDNNLNDIYKDGEPCKGCMLIYQKDVLKKNGGRCALCASSRTLMMQILFSVLGVLISGFPLAVLFIVYDKIPRWLAYSSIASITLGITIYVLAGIINYDSRRKTRMVIFNTQVVAMAAAMNCQNNLAQKEKENEPPKPKDIN